MDHKLRTLFLDTLLSLFCVSSLRGYVILRNAMPPKRFEASIHPIPAETKDDDDDDDDDDDADDEVYLIVYKRCIYIYI